MRNTNIGRLLMIANNIGIFMITEMLQVCGVIWCSLSVCREGGVVCMVGLYCSLLQAFDENCIIAPRVGVL